MSKKSASVQAIVGQSVNQSAGDYDIRAVMSSFTQAQVMAFAEKIEKAFDERKTFEISRVVGGNADLSIVKKLNKVQAKLSLPHLVRAMMALDVNPGFVNHSFSKDGAGSRFNIYAIDKAVDILNAIAGTQKVSNKVNLTSLKAMMKATAGLSRSIAKAALSKQIRTSDAFIKEFADDRHTLAPSTTDTQTSSTMRILQALGLVENRGSARQAVYAFRDTKQAKAFTELLAAA